MGSIIFILLGVLTIVIILMYDYRRKYKVSVKRYIDLKDRHRIDRAYAAKMEADKKESDKRAFLLENELQNLKVLTVKHERPENKVIKAGTASNVRKIFERELAKEEKENV
jgi:hypothetical protein